MKTLFATARSIGNSLVNTFNSFASRFKEIGTNLINQLNSGLAGGRDTLSNTSTSLAQTMISVLKGFNDSFKDIGVNFADGLRLGFLSQKDRIISDVNAMVDAIVASAKSRMKISSPSKVWAEIGNYMAQGLDVGFVNEMKTVTQDINNSLISNCIRFAKSEVFIQIKPVTKGVCFTISDDGPGIHEEDLIHIFDRFYKGKKGKHGLGLSIAKRIVELCRGEILVESKLGEGSRFTVNLPAR